MRKVSFPLLVAVGLLPEAASAQEVSVTLASRYVDTATFNDVYSDEAIVKVEASYDITESIYVSGYVYTGFKSPMNDDSSEYGLEVGGSWPLSESIELNVAAGRMANYQGGGFDAGDWYGKVGLTHGRVSASAAVLSGATDSVLLRAEYELPVTDKLSLVPSGSYLTAYGVVNPAVEVRYQRSERLSVGAAFVLPDHEEGKRKLYAALNLTYTF